MRPVHACEQPPLSKVPWTDTLPWHYSLLHKRTLTESGSHLKACGGRGEDLFKAKSVPARGWASALPFQSTQACPGLLGVGSDGWGVKDSQWGRTSQTSCSQGQKTSHGGGSNNVLCILCRHLAQKGLCPARGDAGLGSSRHLTHIEACSELTSSEGYVVGRLSDWL